MTTAVIKAGIIDDEMQRPTGDSQAYIVSVGEKPEGGVKAKIELRIPQQDLIEALRHRTVINLDATPNRPLLDRLFPNIEAAGIHVPEDVHITQFTDGINGACRLLKFSKKLLKCRFEKERHPCARPCPMLGAIR